jgi:ketosteroid isomerase-like protein
VAGTMTDEELAALVQRITAAAEALISGDIEGYVARIKHAHDYTLMSPYGGDAVRGFDDSDQALDRLAEFFRGGEATVEVVETYTSGDLAVLVVIERQHGTIGDLPEQDWSLRVTWVFRRTSESDWELVHRHADALVHSIDHERLGALARGD